MCGCHLVKRRNDGDYRTPEKLTLGEYLTGKWLPAQRSQLRPSTLHSCTRTIELHVLPTLGKVPMSRLLPEDLDALYGRLLENGRRNKRGVGPVHHAEHGHGLVGAHHQLEPWPLGFARRARVA